MTVTEIKKEKGHLIKISFSDYDDLLLDKDIFEEYPLKTGSVLSEEKAKELKEISEYKRAKSRAYWYLDRNDHTEKGLYGKLVKAGFSKEISAKVLARLKELGLIDDERYAKRYAEKLFESNISKRQIYAKLYEKGIAGDLIKETVDSLPDSEILQIKNIIEKKYSNKLNDKNSVNKVYQALIRKGFSYGGVREVLKNYEEELNYIDGDY